MSNITLYYPRWFWPNNLGDSCIFAYVPRWIKMMRPDATITVVTWGSIIELLEKDPNVDHVRLPTQGEINQPSSHWMALARQHNDIRGDALVIYPENHPDMFTYMKDNFDQFMEHPSVHFVNLNHLLQLKLEHLIPSGYNFAKYEGITPRGRQTGKFSSASATEPFKLAFAPMTKTNGKPSPHPDCDGEGYRFNGLKGLESWRECLRLIRRNLKNCITYEFSPEYLHLGDNHIGIQDSIYDLALIANSMDFGLTTDGGYHHVFNLVELPLVAFTASKVSKVEFSTLGNATIPHDLHVECRKQCPAFYLDVFGGEDKSKTCKMECEDMSPTDLAWFVIDTIRGKKTVIERIPFIGN